MKAKVQSVFYCKNCGNEFNKWQGKCTACNEWNSLVEKKLSVPSKHDKSSKFNIPLAEQSPQRLDEIETGTNIRLSFGDEEFMRVVGGGLMSGSISLVAGEPGIGKSTLFLQLGLKEARKKTLYICGEESPQQIKERAKRIGVDNANFYLFASTQVEDIVEQILQLSPDWVIVDSIQTISSATTEGTQGSMSQLRECTIILQECAKRSGIPIILIGHINKEGAIAGPKILEHIVDTVILFEGEKYYNYRMLRSSKNRFGNVAELGIYEMTPKGMVGVKNPNEILLTSRGKNICGASVGCINEGLRTFFVEVQALVTPTYYATPQRTASGIEQRKLQLICAVLEKVCKLQLGNKDIFITLVGGMKTSDPAIDLAIAMAIVSSYMDIAIPSNFCFSGELSLSGEVRSVGKIEQRIKESVKTGFHTFVCSVYNFKTPIQNETTRIYLLKELAELIQLLKSNNNP